MVAKMFMKICLILKFWIEKCENLMHEAIRYAKESKEELEKAMSEKDKTEREILHSKGVQHYGYAHGINQALVELGFKHEKMKELYKCL